MVFTSIDHLPYFFPLLGTVLLLVLFFLGTAVLGITKKQTYLLLSYYYVVFAAFVVLVDVFVRLGVSYTVAIFFISIIILGLSLTGYWKKREQIVSWLKYEKAHRIQWVTLLVVMVFSTFIFSKFIFNNGLHDEYQHHAAVEDMLQTNHWPIRDELRYGIDLSDYYHYGWYYLVILVTSVTNASIEVSLDIAKLILFFPILPLFYSLVQRFLQTKWYTSLSIAVLLLVQGPAFLFLDAYTGNVFFSQGNEIIYEPLFFQLAGITWFGIILLVAFATVVHNLVQKSLSIKAVLFAVFFTWSLYILNKVFLLIFIPFSVLLIINSYQNTIENLLRKHKKIWMMGVLSLPFIALGLYLGITMVSPIFFTLLRGDSGIPFVRSFRLWGFPYSSHDGLAFQPAFSWGSLRAFGIMPLISGAVLLWSIFSNKNKYKTVLILLFWLFLWIVPVALNFSGSELALNKFYIPALWVSVLITIHFLLQQKVRIQIVGVGLLFSAMLAPSVYFSSISLQNSHRYWKYSDPIIKYLSEENKLITASIDDYEYAKYLINNLDIQLISARTPNIDIAEVVEYEVTTENHVDEKPLAQTDTHYLYAK